MKYILWIFGSAAILAGGVYAQTDPSSTGCEGLKTRAERAENRLKDWPNLARYAADNARISAPARNENRVVFMGDSITDSWKLAEYFPGRPYINRGISGQTTPQMLIRFRPDVIELKPKVVVILAGTNDIAGNTGPMTLEAIQQNIRSMAELARANGVRVVLASVLPISDHNTNAQGQKIIRSLARPPERIKSLNSWIRNFASEHGYVYLDYYAATSDENGSLKRNIADDGLHPNAEGYKLMAPLAERAIADALKQIRSK